MLSIYVEYLITELLKAHGGKLVSVMESEIRMIVQAAVDQAAAAQRERDMLIAHDRATQWDAIKAAHPDDAATPAIANARYLEARYLEACDIAALIRAQP